MDCVHFRYPSRGQAPKIYAMRLNFKSLTPLKDPIQKSKKTILINTDQALAILLIEPYHNLKWTRKKMPLE